ncbi:hypothetical protein K493DRAFT_300898 [Basidiobolus meristosporus CBS 931.73]|uniref:Carrier domain-containing protein n=1 Tax=Basidiobolus meristosporus CBS 931.73 TaxID=1314790 RepID=A0A1Y1YEM5_9FUNG|nr:hypothetical protein K493DRAFT_300898 [Basidiobolus meristosporus CBS 931.73]|eukprot:ORX96490.1 hypothetical protein K493DRAFT_300898 [Basidiobolus meristosporus CBS 931.73]
MRHILAQSEQKSLLEALVPSIDRADELSVLPIIMAANMCILVYRYTNTQDFTLDFSHSEARDEPLQIVISLRPDMSAAELLQLIEERVMVSHQSRLPPISGLAISLHAVDSAYDESTNSEIRMHISSHKDAHEQVVSTVDVSKSLLSKCSGESSIIGHWSTLLEHLALQPDFPVSRISILSPSEMELVTSAAWSSTPAITDSQVPAHQNTSADEMYLHTIFENTAHKYPNHTAILYEDQTGQDKAYTYQEIDNASSRLAKHISDHYITGPGKFIGLLMPQVPTAYIAMLAILKTGSAYVPIDPSYPLERVEYILRDSNAELLLSEKATVERQLGQDLTCQVLYVDGWLADKASLNECFKLPSGALQMSDAAYMIYTSGTTGRPKGVVIEHRNVVNLVRAESVVFNMKTEDRVYQQFSLAFDASIEEIWLPFMVGGTLVPAAQKPGPGLSEILEYKGVTVLSCVPTLLAMLSEDEKLQSLRLLILGGEACPKSLVQRFGVGCQIVNSYGPTETTVVATWKVCSPTDDVVTIGHPMPGYSAFILSEYDQLQPIGVAGELVIGGSGVTRGYHNLPEFTKKKFIQHSLLSPVGQLYKTGDLARYNQAGEIEYLGRIDTQVKLRGYRIELSEVESALQRCSGVKVAVVDIHVDSYNVEHLIAYITTSTKESLVNTQAIKEELLKTVPNFMVPSIFQIVRDLPTLPSGKIDRKHLPKVMAGTLVTAEDASKKVVAPRTPTETKLVDIWSRFFKSNAISVTDNFFSLGGHSLLAAMLVSELRKSENTKGISMGHIYQYSILESLANFIDTCIGPTSDRSPTAHRSPMNSGTDPGNGDIEKLNNLDRAKFPPILGYVQSFALLLCQFVAIFSVLLITTLPVSVLYLLYKFTNVPIIVVVFVFALDFCWMPLIAVIVKWLLIGKYRPGKWPLWGCYYWRWWVVQSVVRVLKLYLLEGSPLLNIFYNLMGAKVHMTAYVGTRHIGCYDLLTIEAGASVGLNAYMYGYKVENGWLIIGSGIRVGSGARVGNKSNLGLSSELQDGADLDDLSVLQDKQVIKKNERWAGSPAKFISNVEESEQATTSHVATWLFCFLYFIIALVVNTTFGLLASLTGILVLEVVPILLPTFNPYISVIVATPFVTTVAMMLFCLGIVILKLIILPKISPGEYKLQSFFYLRKWCLDILMQISLEVVNSVYGTLYAPHWLRALGAKIGKTSEVSTVTYISPNLLRVGSGCFLADSVVVGPPRIRYGKITLDYSTIDERSFVGNGALFPAGIVMGRDCLLGVLSTPDHDVRALADNTSWLGSPAMFLPNRQVATTSWPKERTYAPTNGLYVARYLIELWRVFLPNMVNITTFVVLVVVLEIIYEGTSDRDVLPVPDEFLMTDGLLLNLSHGALVGSFVLVFLIVNGLLAIGACCFVLLAKWILIGTYAAREAPLWSSFVWRTELVTALHEGIASRQLLQSLRGTPFVSFWFRLLGCHIGKRVWMDTLQITEHDLIHIEDDVSIGADTILQTHLFEDRIMKMDHLVIGRRSNIGASSVILYGTTLEEDVSIGSLSLVMKGETLPTHTTWNGIPLQHARDGS